MANNPYVSRLKKIAAENNKLDEFENKLNELQNPSTEDIKRVFAEIGLQLPHMGQKKLSDEEKEERLIDIYRNGTNEEKKAINKIIADHEKNIEIEASKKALKDAKQALKKLGLTEEQIAQV